MVFRILRRLLVYHIAMIKKRRIRPLFFIEYKNDTGLPYRYAKVEWVRIMELHFMKWGFLLAGIGNLLVVLYGYLWMQELLYLNIIASLCGFILSLMSTSRKVRKHR